MVAVPYLVCNASGQSVEKCLQFQSSHPNELSKDPAPVRESKIYKTKSLEAI